MLIFCTEVAFQGWLCIMQYSDLLGTVLGFVCSGAVLDCIRIRLEVRLLDGMVAPSGLEGQNTSHQDKWIRIANAFRPQLAGFLSGKDRDIFQDLVLPLMCASGSFRIKHVSTASKHDDTEQNAVQYKTVLRNSSAS